MRLPAWLLWAATAVTIVFAEDSKYNTNKIFSSSKKMLYCSKPVP